MWSTSRDARRTWLTPCREQILMVRMTRIQSWQRTLKSWYTQLWGIYQPVLESCNISGMPPRLAQCYRSCNVLLWKDGLSRGNRYPMMFWNIGTFEMSWVAWMVWYWQEHTWRYQSAWGQECWFSCMKLTWESKKPKHVPGGYYSGLEYLVIYRITLLTVLCVKYKPENGREPLLHQVPDGPFLKVAMDLFHYNGADYVIMVDCFSTYPEIARLNGTLAAAVIPMWKVSSHVMACRRR